MCEENRHHSDHDHHAEAHRPHTEPVVLEIGGEVGALVVCTDATLLHREIEISAAGEDGRRSHKDVRERVAGARSVYAAVSDRIQGGVHALAQGRSARTWRSCPGRRDRRA
jgi:hypothetical protein